MNGALAVFHGHLLAIATLPESTLAVLKHLVVIPVARTSGISVGNLPQCVSREGIESPARSAYQDFTILSLQERGHTRLHAVGKRVAHKAVSHIVVACQAQSRANPQPSLAVAQEGRDNVAFNGVGVARR